MYMKCGQQFKGTEERCNNPPSKATEGTKKRRAWEDITAVFRFCQTLLTSIPAFHECLKLSICIPHPQNVLLLLPLLTNGNIIHLMPQTKNLDMMPNHTLFPYLLILLQVLLIF